MDEQEPTGEGKYFPVSTTKLVAMSVCTFGIYEMYWAWNCWEYIKHRDGRSFNSVWRSNWIFALPFNFLLFWDISRASGNTKSVALLQSLTLGLGYALCWISGLVFEGSGLWWIPFFGFLVLIPIQGQINRINRRTQPDHDPNTHWSKWNLAAIAVGGLLLVLTLLATWAVQRELG